MNKVIKYILFMFINGKGTIKLRGIIFLAVISPFYLNAQENNIRFQSLQQGLSNKFIRCIHKDNRGFMWFGTYNGLNKFDGTNITVYLHDPADSNSISNNTINAITEDDNGNIWVGTSEGLNIYDIFYDRFTDPNTIPGVKNEMNFSCVTALYSDRENTIWIGTLGGGINIFNQKKLEFDYCYLSDSLNRGNGMDYINCLLPENKENIWAGTRKGLYLFDTKQRSIIPFQENNTRIDLSVANIISIIRNNSQSFWVATSDYGLLLIDKKPDNKYHITTFEEFIESKTFTVKNIKTLCLSSQNRLWIGTENGGLVLLDIPASKLYSYLPEEGNPNSITSNSIWAIYADNEERIWIGTYNKGICIYDKRLNRFEDYRRNPFRKKTLTDNDVTGFAEDSRGNIWVATDGGGINIFDPESRQFVSAINKESNKSKFENNAVKCILYDSENNIWAGTWGNGVEKVGQNKNDIVNYQVTAKGVGDNNIFCLYEDSRNNIWAGTAGSGLFRFDRNKKQFVQAGEQKSKIGTPTIAFVTSIFEESDNTLWVGTLYGLYVFIPNSRGSFTKKVFYHDQQPGSISSDRIQCIFEDSKKNIWVGTFDAGLNLYDKNTSSFNVFQQKQGLASNMVEGILEDRNGNLWISSDKGITRFNAVKDTMRIFTKSDGLLSNEFYHDACLMTKKGEIYFGSDKGFNAFFPDSIKDNNIKPVMYFTGFKVNNAPVKIGVKGSVLQKHISTTGQITLDHTQTTFTIEYVGINYTQPANNSYRYRMIGYNEDWNYVGNNTGVTFTGLKPGKYRFVVEGANNDGLWCDKAAEISIIIKSPFWKTWWAYLIYIILILTVIVIVFRIRLDRLHMQNSLKMERMEREKEHELNQYKTQFFTNISHEFRTPLSLITAPLESIISSPDIKSNLKSKLYTIYKNASRLMQLVDELMDFRKLENRKMMLKVQRGDIVKFISELASSYNEMALQKNIEFRTIPVIPSVSGWFDGNALEKILHNLLSNAFKFSSDGDSIFIEINEVNNTVSNRPALKDKLVTISVTDTGKGINEEDMPYIFDRFYQSKSSSGKGTGIGLALVKNLVELHHGTISVQSNPGIKTIFTVTLPLNPEAYSNEEIINSPVDIIDAGKDEYRLKEDIKEDLEKQDDDSNKPEILIVEDNDDLRNYLATELGRNYNITIAEDGIKGSQVARELIPDLIISDVLMPGKNGIELCNELKKDINTSHIPVILLTAKTTLDDQIEGLEHGADVYITKPFSIRFLNAQIKQLIANRDMLYKIFSQEVHIIPGKFTRNKLDEDFLMSVINYVTENITDSQLGVEAIAGKMNMSRSQLYRKIKALTGQTAVEFVRVIRLKQAIKLMETRKFSLAEIAYQIGFTTPSYFTRSFKEYYGKSPSDYLNNDD